MVKASEIVKYFAPYAVKTQRIEAFLSSCDLAAFDRVPRVDSSGVVAWANGETNAGIVKPPAGLYKIGR